MSVKSEEGGEAEEDMGRKRKENVPLRDLKLVLMRSSMAGIKNASVLPEPVLAAPSTSRPERSTGMQRAWTSVMRVKPMSVIALRVLSVTSRESKL